MLSSVLRESSQWTLVLICQMSHGSISHILILRSEEDRIFLLLQIF